MLVDTLRLTADEETRLRDALDASSDADARLAMACATAHTLRRLVRADRLGEAVRRPLPSLEGQTLLHVLIDDPIRANRLVTAAFDWSGSA